MMTRRRPYVLSILCGMCLGCVGDDEAAVSSSGGSSGGSAGGGPVDIDEADGTDAPFARACARLHGECAPVCDNPFVECYDDPQTCTQQWKAEYLEDFDFPMADPVRLARCAEQVERSACTDIEPDTVECEFAVVEQCPDDLDAHRPYSPFWAQRIAMGDTLRVHLCEDVVEYYVVSLQAGERIAVEVPDDAPSLSIDLLRLTATDAGDAVLEELGLDIPVPLAGDYIVALEAFERGDHDVTVQLAD